MICIIGAGPAGLAAAIALGEKALILEANPFAGKKLLLSGSGQCNFTNNLPTEAFLKRLGEYRNWLKPAFLAHDNQFFIQLLQDANCPIFVREDGKVFPASKRSASVRDALLALALASGAKIRYDSKVKDIVLQGDSYNVILSGGDRVSCNQVIIASGGASWPITGSDGSSYRLAKKLGHSVIESRPALAGVKVLNFSPYSHWAGISFQAAQMEFEKFKISGDLLFTHQGLSGPLILDNSYRFYPGCTLKLILVPDADRKLQELIQCHPRKQIGSLISQSGIPERIVNTLLPGSDTRAADFTKAQRKTLSDKLSGLCFTIQKVEGMDIAMSDFGGVPLTEVNSKTMESRLRKNLFFVGESLAYSLPTGGFSVQMAFSTGFLAGASIKKMLYI